ncbi:MAG: molybdenum cofactor guanylyltransferase MobA [Elioraea sp.]|nr:molybdenum cofactor guanylyltransferase MobA [Elioraea sp.]
MQPAERVVPRALGHPPTLGVLLAGGQGRRMGGVDKGLLRIGEETILARIVARLAPSCAGLIVNANGEPSRFAALGLPVVPDPVEGYAGPLAGVLAALEWASERRPDLAWVVTVSTDSPFLPRDLVPRLHAARAAAGTPLACAASGGRMHPPIGLWPISLRADLRRALTEEGERKIDRWTARHGVAVAEWPTDPLDPFFNVNTPEDAAIAQSLAVRFPQA